MLGDFMDKNNKQEYKSIKEIADEWGVSVRRVQILCTSGRIPGALKVGRSWMIPASIKRPTDKRVKKKDFGSMTAEEVRMHDLTFLSAVSQSLRTDLNSILGFANLLRKDTVKTDQVKGYADNILISGGRLLDITEKVLMIVQIEKNEIQQKEEVCVAGEFLQETSDELKELLEKKKQNVSVTKKVNHNIVYQDTEKHKLLFANLLELLSKVAAENSEITVNLTELSGEDKENCWYRYAITAKLAENSQKSATQLVEALTNENDFSGEMQEGGLALLLIKRLMILFDGSLKAEKKGDNEICFTTELPYRISKLSEIRRKGEAAELLKFQGLRVLLAEDNDLNREMEEELLADAGFRVESAEDGIVCLAMLKKAPPGYYDLVLMDIQMPNLDGLMATRVIRGLQDREKASIPVIAMTADVSYENRNAAEEAGMNAFIEKPIKMSNVSAVIRSVLTEKVNK